MEKCVVSGQLVDDKENPISNIQLKAIADYSSTFDDDPLLGDAVTDKNGKFEIDFPLNSKFMENKKNKIKIEFFIDEKKIMDISKDIQDEIIDFGIIKFDKGNIGVHGRIIDEKGNPIEGLTVIAEDEDYGKLELNVLDLVESKVKSFIKNKNLIPDEGILGNSKDFITDKFKPLLSLRDDYLGSAVTDENGYYQYQFTLKKVTEKF